MAEERRQVVGGGGRREEGRGGGEVGQNGAGGLKKVCSKVVATAACLSPVFVKHAWRVGGEGGRAVRGKRGGGGGGGGRVRFGWGFV